MFSRIFLRPNTCSLIHQYGEKRDFRRWAPWLASATSKETTGTTTAIPGVRVSITPAVSIIPKRAPSAYNLFTMEKIKELSDGKQGLLKRGEAMKQVGPQWKKLGEHERQRYESESTRLQKEYDDAFLRMPTEEFRRVVMAEMQRLQTKRVTALRRQQRELKAAHEFPQADTDMFRLTAMAKDHGDEITKGQVPERGIQIGRMWSALPENKKAAYVKREKTARAHYRKRVDQWEKKMVNQGLKHVVDTIKMRPQKKLSGIPRRRPRKVLASKVAIGKQEATAGTKKARGRKRAQKVKAEE